MRRRLTVSLLVLLAATLAVTTVASFLLIRRAAVISAQQQLAGQARAIAATLAGGAAVTRPAYRRELAVIADAGAFSGIAVVYLQPDGTVSGRVPSGARLGPAQVRALERGHQVTGHTASLLVFSATPTALRRVVDETPILVITRQAHDPATGLRYFLVVAVAGLVVAAAVAAALARRFTRPIRAAVVTTERIAAGDFDATMPVRRHEDPEFVQLARSIDAMGANLVRARDQERQFLLSVSHELRTPLTSIRGYADAVLDGTADDPRAAAAVIGTESRRLERLVQDLLDLARLDAGRFSLRVGAVDVVEAVRGAAEGFRPRTDALGITLDLAAGSGPSWILADADRVAQIVANLLENASSFARSRVAVGVATGAGGPVVRVEDDGPGVPPEELPRIFERHFSSDRVAGRHRGSGLGLAIVSELAWAMGGAVRVVSPLDGRAGTRMEVTFPAVPPSDVPVAAGPPVPLPPRRPPDRDDGGRPAGAEPATDERRSSG